MADLLKGSRSKATPNGGRGATKKGKKKEPRKGYGIFANEHVSITFAIEEVNSVSSSEGQKKKKDRGGGTRHMGRRRKPKDRNKEPKGEGEGGEAPTLEQAETDVSPPPRVKFQDENTTSGESVGSTALSPPPTGASVWISSPPPLRRLQRSQSVSPP